MTCPKCGLSTVELETLLDRSDEKLARLEAKYESLERSILDLSHPNCKMLIEDNTKLEAKITLLRKAIEPFTNLTYNAIDIDNVKRAYDESV